MSLFVPVRIMLIFVLAISTSLLVTATLHAQSGSRSSAPRYAPRNNPAPRRSVAPRRSAPPRRSVAPQGSDSRQATAGSANAGSTNGGSTNGGRANAGRVAISGYCPVCVIDSKEWVAGKPAIQASFDGHTYYFPGERQKRTFLANPEKYAPVLGGDCTVCLLDMNQRNPGSVHHAAISGGRLYLFPSAAVKDKFRSDPGRYVQADLALGGKCAVCRVEMNKEVDGNPATALTYGGMRYQFPGEDQMKMFIANPAKYAGNAASPAGGSGSKPAGGSGAR